MRKFIPYLLVVLICGAVITLLLTDRPVSKKTIDQRLSLNEKDKVPYGTYVAYRTLGDMFPSARIFNSDDEPGYWDSLSNYESGQLYFSLSTKFDADDNELDKLFKFASAGNDVFIVAQSISSATDRFIGGSSSAYDFAFVPFIEMPVKMKLNLEHPPFDKGTFYQYPGKTLASYFTTLDTMKATVLGRDAARRPNFIHMEAGKGNFFIHLEPLAFSNYFLLHKENIRYYENVLSLIDPGVKKIVWDKYYSKKKSSSPPPKEKKGWFNVFMSNASLRAGLLTALFALLVYVLLEMRRKQRIIPVLTSPKNDSLDFVKTIGRLYFDKGDHANLTWKMSTYFLEHVRNRYKIQTSKLDDDFIKLLQNKSGVNEEEIREIVNFIRFGESAQEVSAQQVTLFYHKLENFYKKA